ncbi:cytochrome P450 [Streptomyces sp. NPDC055722]
MSHAPSWPFDRPERLVPPREYAELRGTCPMARVTIYSGEEAWLATRWADVRAVLTSQSFSITPHTEGVYPAPSKAFHDYALTKASFDKLDPPRHDVERRMLQKDFMLRRVQEYRPFLESLADELLERMGDLPQPVDLVKELGHVLPAGLTCEMIGVPHTDADYLRSQMAAFVSQTSTTEQIRDALDNLTKYFEAVILDKEANPSDDLASRIVHEQILPGHLTRERGAAMLNVLLMGGFDTTSSMIGLGTIVMLEHPEELAKVQADPSLWQNAVEELLRYLTIAHLTGARIAKEDVRVGDHYLAAGDGVFASLVAANRDPEVFADPDRFKVTREAQRHVAFGFGVHQCIGQALARLELQIVFSRMFARYPGMTAVTTSETVQLSSSSVVTPLEVLVDLHGGAR